jgi:hypothetical protein
MTVRFFFELILESLMIATIAGLACELSLSCGKIVWIYSMAFGTSMASFVAIIALIQYEWLAKKRYPI